MSFGPVTKAYAGGLQESYRGRVHAESLIDTETATYCSCEHEHI